MPHLHTTKYMFFQIMMPALKTAFDLWYLFPDPARRASWPPHLLLYIATGPKIYQDPQHPWSSVPIHWCCFTFSHHYLKKPHHKFSFPEILFLKYEDQEDNIKYTKMMLLENLQDQWCTFSSWLPHKLGHKYYYRDWVWIWITCSLTRMKWYPWYYFFFCVGHH